MLVALVAFGIALGRMQERARAAGRSDLPSLAIRNVVTPAATIVDAASRGISDFFGGMGRSGALAEEVRRLGALARASESYSVREDALTNELNELRSLVGMRNYGAIKLLCSVIGVFPFENRFMLDVGRDAGVKPGSAVVTSDGLIGVVQTVDATTCQGLLVVSPVQRVGAMVMREPPTVGILRGESSRSLTLEFVDTRTTIEVGDWVVTSGYSSTIPRGIPIGRVAEVRDEPDFGTRRVRIAPVARLGWSRSVAVLR